jgi:glycosyltransferase involved in cell wall biosynthesis
MGEVFASKVEISTARVKVLKILGDRKVGGIMKTMGGLIDSAIGENFTFTLRSLPEVRSALAEIKPDLAIVHDPCNWNLLPHLWQIRQHCQVIIHDHHYSEGFERYNVKQKQRFRLMLRLCYGSASHVIAVSQAQSDWMLQNQLVAPHKLKTITQTTPIDKLLVLPPRVMQPPLVLGAYGQFTRQKGFDILLQAVRQLPETMVKLRIGGYGEDEQKLKQLSQGRSNIEFFGMLDNVAAFMAGCDVIIIPSRWEPWGNVCLEAKAAARPAIASNVDGLVEQMTDCGLLVKPDDPQALAEAIAHFCTLPNCQLRTWGENGRNNVKDARQHYLERWESLLWSIVRQRS